MRVRNVVAAQSRKIGNTAHKTPNRHWNDVRNQRHFFDNHLAPQLNIQTTNDWYGVSNLDVKRNGGRGILFKHSDSILVALRTIYPETEWSELQLNRVPKSYLDNVATLKQLMESIGSKIGIQSMEHWYNVTLEDIVRHGGGRIVERYDKSISRALKSIFPEIKWIEWKFKHAPLGYWQNMENQRNKMDFASQELNYKTVDDWERVNRRSLIKHVGLGLLNEYNNSGSKALRAIYPAHSWDHIRSRRSSGHWQTKQNVINFLQNTERLLGIKNPNAWYRVSKKQLMKLGGSGVLNGQFPQCLRYVYPTQNWKMEQFSKREKRSYQRILFVLSARALAPFEVLEDANIAERIGSVLPVIVDVFVPALSLALEYQGEHHYHDNIALYGSASFQKSRDDVKHQMCKSAGISLIKIPYWWDFKIDSLKATIAYFRPDILLTMSKKSRPVIEPSLAQRKGYFK